MLTAWNRVATTLDPIATPKEAGFKSDLLNDIAYALPTLREPLVAIMGQIDLAHARDNDKAELWVDSEKYPGELNLNVWVGSSPNELACRDR